MKKVLILLVLVFTIMSFSATLFDVIESAKATSTTYELSNLEYVLMEMEYDKNKIMATNQKSELSAEINFLNSLKENKKTVERFYTDTINTYFDYLIDKLDYESTELKIKNARIDLENKKKLFEKKLISVDELKNAELTLSDLENSITSKKVKMLDSKNDLIEIYSKEISEIKVSLIDYANYLVDDKVYFDNNYDYKILEKNKELNEVEMKTLPSNSSEFDIKNLELKNRKLEVNIKDSEDALYKSHRDLKNQLESFKISIKNLEERINLSKTTYEDTNNKFINGLASEAELNKSKADYIDSSKTYYETMKQYFNSFVKYLLDTGRRPEEVLN
jgi:hypothetical protein